MKRRSAFQLLVFSILLIGLLLSEGSLYDLLAQGPDHEPPTYQLRQKSVNDGLSNNTVYSIQEDKYGFLWIGTESGLNRFDSREWVRYYFNPNDTSGLSNSKIPAILSDRQGRLWIGTAKGLNIFSIESNTFTRFPNEKDSVKLPGEYIRVLYQDSDYDIWIGTSEGLSLLSEKSGLSTLNNIILGNASDAENNIIEIYEDSQGIIWIGTGGGLFYTRNKKDFYSINLADHKEAVMEKVQIRSLAEIDDVLLIATENTGLFAYYRKEGKFKKLSVHCEGNSKELIYRKLFIDSDSILWIASTSGLFNLPKADFPFGFSESNELIAQEVNDNSVRTIFEDQGQGKWIGTQYQGLFYHYSDNFLFNKAEADPVENAGLNNSVVSAFYVEKDSIWIGTDGGGLNLWLPKKNRFDYFTKEDGLVNNNIKCLKKDKEGRLWIGTFKGLSIFSKGNFQNYTLNEVNTQGNREPSSHFLSICFDPEQNYTWLGTDGFGLVKFDPGTEKFYPVIPSDKKFNASSVNDILPVNDSTLLLATSSGLFTFNTKDESFHEQRVILSNPENKVSFIICLERVDQNRFWIGTEKYGLILYDLKKQKSSFFPALSNLPGMVINAIHQINGQEIWFSTNKGLYKSIIELNGDSLELIKLSHFEESYGIQSKQFMPRSSFHTSNNQLFFGGIEGFNYFFPDEISYQPSEVSCYIKSLSYWNGKEDEIKDVQQIFPSGSELVFHPYIRDITLEFIGINYSHPENTRYSYRFSGEGENWIELGRRNLITFNHLPPGDYSIDIRATQESYHGPATVTHLQITMLPPFWKSGFAITIYVLAILLLLYMFYRTITRWERLRSDLKVEQVRREQEKELHEQRIRFFTDISHELRTPLTLILSPIDMIIRNHPLSMRVMNSLQMVKQNGEKMLQLINQLLDLRKADAGYLKFNAAKGNLVRFVREVMLSFRDMALHREIDMGFNCRKQNIEAYFDRDKFEIIITNLIANALKHTPAKGKVRLSIEEHADPGNTSISKFPDGFVQIIIQDTGKGIPADKIERIFDRFFDADSGIKGSGIGLELTKKYVELHGGTIAVESQQEKPGRNSYTKFILKIPLGRRHLKDEQITGNYISSEDLKAYIAPSAEKSLHLDLEEEMKNIPSS